MSRRERSRERDRDIDRDRDRERDRGRDRERDYHTAVHIDKYRSTDPRDDDKYSKYDSKHSNAQSSRSHSIESSERKKLPRSKRHRDSTFRSYWDVLPDPNNPPPDPLAFLQAQPNAPKVKGSSTSQSNDDPTTRNARRLYLGNLQGQVTDDEVRQGWNEILAFYYPDLVTPGGAVSSVYINHEKKFAFIEVHTMEEAAASILLDQVHWRGQPLKVRRPMDYDPSMWPVINVPPPAHGGPHAQNNGAAANQVSTQVPDGPNKVFVGGLPYNLSEQEVKELLQAFGPLKGFHMVRDKDTNLSKGYGFFEYVDPSVTDAALNGLNGLKIGERTLTIRRAITREQAAANAAGVSDPSQLTAAQLGQIAVMQANMTQIQKPPTRILVLTNMFELHELSNESDYNDIKADITGECGKYGTLLSTVLPRAGEVGAGKVFLEYQTPDAAARIRSEVEGRQFGNHVVIADYLDEQAFYHGDLA